MMTTTYPGTLDDFSTKLTGQIVEASHVNDLQDAVEAVEAVLGEEGNNGICEGRLTLLSGSPVTLADQAAKTAVYFTPYKGDRISLYDGSAGWDTLHFTEKSVSVPATTVTPFDVFAYSSGGTVTLETVNWTNDTTRATALTTQNGVYVKAGDATRRYLGTCRTTSVSGQCEDSVAHRFVWNYYNRLERRLLKSNSTGHDYNTAAWRAWNNDATILTDFMVGVLEDSIQVTASLQITRNAATDGVPAMWIYLNGAGIGSYTLLNIADVDIHRHSNTAVGDPRLGYNFVNVYQYTFAGATAPTYDDFNLGGIVKG